MSKTAYEIAFALSWDGQLRHISQAQAENIIETVLKEEKEKAKPQQKETK